MVDTSLQNPWRHDVPSALVVVLVAIPLCVGIALASGAPLTAGLLSGVIGGIVVGSLSSSNVMVSGPAAGLVAIVGAGIISLGSLRAFSAAVVMAGLLQLVLSALKVGNVGYFFPRAVIRGMVAAIGVILVLKQIPHAVGFDVGYVGDESFRQANAETTFSTLGLMLDAVHPGAVLVTLTTLAVLIGWNRWRPWRTVPVVPAAILAALVGVVVSMLLPTLSPSLALDSSHLVQLPSSLSSTEWRELLRGPDWSALMRRETWGLALTLALVASLETLLSLEASDQLDPQKRPSDPNRELLAQGAGNLVAGLVGGLPISGVIVRSAANIDAGAATRRSTVLHGVLLLIAVLTLPLVLNRVPLSVVAAILLFTGFKLASPSVWRTLWNAGRAQFIPFAVTLVAIVLTDLLIGVTIGFGVAVFFILSEHLRQPALRQVSGHGAVLTRFELPDQATFLNKANLERTLDALPAGSRVEIDGRHTMRFDLDVLQQLHEFTETARRRDIDYRLVGIPATVASPLHTF